MSGEPSSYDSKKQSNIDLKALSDCYYLGITQADLLSFPQQIRKLLNTVSEFKQDLTVASEHEPSSDVHASYWQTTFTSVREKVLQAGYKVSMPAERLFCILSGKVQLRGKILDEGEFIYYSGVKKFNNMQIDKFANNVCVEIMQTTALYEIKTDFKRRRPNDF